MRYVYGYWAEANFGFQNGVLGPNAKLSAKVVPKVIKVPNVTTGAQASTHTCEHAMHGAPVRMN